MADSQTPFARAELAVRAVEWKEITSRPLATEPGNPFPVKEAMPVSSALFRAIQKTLEVMFFVDVDSPQNAGARPGSAAPSPASPPEDPRPPEEGKLPKETKLWVEVCFEGTRDGCVRLGLHPSLAFYCHEGFQPDDALADDPFSLDFHQDAPEESPDPMPELRQLTPAVQHSLLELGNIVCGAFLSNAWPQGLFRVKAPVIIGSGSAPGAIASQTLAACCACETAEGPVEARAYFHQEALRGDG